MLFLSLEKTFKYSKRTLSIGSSNDEGKSTITLLGKNENQNNK